MAQGYLFNFYKGAPLVKKGGTMIVFHPCTDQFDKEHHAPYVEFVHDVLAQTRDAAVMHAKFEEKFARNPAYIEMYRKGTRTTRPTPSSCGTGARRAGSTSGASSSWAPTTTTSPSSSAGRRRGRSPRRSPWRRARRRDPEITMLHVPPIVMADVTV